MQTEHLYNKSMNITTFEYAQLGLTVARFASQLKEGVIIDCNVSFNNKNGDYTIIGLYRAPANEGNFPSVISSFYSSGFNNLRELLDAVFNCCVDMDLFKVPLDIKIID